jgi:GNAT superfamily N-acetyltransferase
MAPCEVTIRRMTENDIPLGMRLKEQAGWNQVEADWRRFLAMEPEGCFVAEWNGKPVGTTVACTFDSVAWLAMVLVDESVRGRGVGKAMLKHALRFLDDRGVRTVRLDATAAGEPLYRTLGFEPQFNLVRYAGIVLPLLEAIPFPDIQGIKKADRTRWEEIVSLDAEVTRTLRRKFLLRMLEENPRYARVVVHDEKLTASAYCLARRGSRATQVGPCLGESVAANKLFAAVLVFLFRGESVFVDVLESDNVTKATLTTCCLTPQRLFTRMCRGESVIEDLNLFVASSGPELG